jgi:hypothetical protein
MNGHPDCCLFRKRIPDCGSLSSQMSLTPYLGTGLTLLDTVRRRQMCSVKFLN